MRQILTNAPAFVSAYLESTGAPFNRAKVLNAPQMVRRVYLTELVGEIHEEYGRQVETFNKENSPKITDFERLTKGLIKHAILDMARAEEVAAQDGSP